MKTQENYEITGMNYKQFYKELGHLLYAIAKSDDQVRVQEIKEMKKFVLEELALFETRYDSSGMNEAFYTQFEFDESFDKHVSSTEAYASFIQFAKINSKNISDYMKKTIIAAAEKVAAAYKRTNKKEKELINSLKEELKALKN
jgi:hypothetical protein